MTDYTPTTEQVRNAYVRGMRDTFIASAGEHYEEFDRWTRAHDDEARAFVQLPTREQIAKYEALVAEWRTEGIDHEMGRYRAANYAHQLADALDAVLALFPQPTPSAEPEVDVCLYCHGAGYYDGGDMRDDEPCNACRGTGLAEPPRIEYMASGTTFTAEHKREALAAKAWLTRGENRFRVTDRAGRQWLLENVDPSTIRDVTPPPTTPEEGDVYQPDTHAIADSDTDPEEGDRG